jgi:hypothetical protein
MGKFATRGHRWKNGASRKLAQHAIDKFQHREINALFGEVPGTERPVA